MDADGHGVSQVDQVLAGGTQSAESLVAGRNLGAGYHSVGTKKQAETTPVA